MNTFHLIEQTNQPAGLWKRVLAFIIDQVLLTVALLVIFFGIGVIVAAVFGVTPEQLPDFQTPLVLFGLALRMLYFILMESSPKQATIGKIMLGLKVTDSAGNRLTLARSTVRNVAKLLTIMSLGAGFVMGAFRKNRQSLHDLIAETLVMSERGDVSVVPQTNTLAADRPLQQGIFQQGYSSPVFAQQVYPSAPPSMQ